VSVSYRTDGDPSAPAVLLCNALGTDLHLWSAQVEALAADHHVVRYDTRGAATFDDLVAEPLALLDSLGIEQAAVCGTALGALIALAVVARHPERVTRLVLANIAARPGTPASWQARADLARSGGMAAIADLALPKFFTPAFAARHPEVVRRMRETMLRSDPSGYAACCDALRMTDLRGEADRVRAPTLVIAGAHDQLTPPEEGRELHERIAGSRFLLLDAAHLACVEQPAAFNAAVLPFLRGG